MAKTETERERDRLKQSLEALWTTLAPSKSSWIQQVLKNSKAAFGRPLTDTDNATLRKQTLAYQKDLALCRKVLFYIRGNTYHTTRAHRAADRCLKELKQK